MEFLLFRIKYFEVFIYSSWKEYIMLYLNLNMYILWYYYQIGYIKVYNFVVEIEYFM